MAKTMAPSTITIPATGDTEATSFTVNVLPDVFDRRDLIYRPRLQPLLPNLDRRLLHGGLPFIMKQKGGSCTGHAVSAVMNTVLTQTPPFNSNGHFPNGSTLHVPRISAYMLYHLGRRYDEFPGEDDKGSSLRGVLKGWFHHGVLLEDDWHSLEMDPEPDYNDDIEVKRKCLKFPLGAYYRVTANALDDMQSAVNELCAIAASAIIHTGWATPIWKTPPEGGQAMCIIDRNQNTVQKGGHAFAIVGYNEVGFVVQNSWGTTWGDGGFAVLPYEDWLDNALDAWVARMGVPKTPFATGRHHTTSRAGGTVATVPGIDEKRLTFHVVNLANNGFLSTRGKSTSSPLQIEKIFRRMEDWHSQWHKQVEDKRHIVLYAHGGLVTEEGGLAIAENHLNWWLNNHIYPLYFVWESGAIETVLSQLDDLFASLIPASVGFEEDLLEQWDRAIEKAVRVGLQGVWQEMKENAQAASGVIENEEQIRWPPTSTISQQAMMKMPGASLMVDRLKRYVDNLNTKGIKNVSIHLVGHSGGAVFHAALLERLIGAGIQVDSMTFMAAGLRLDVFEKDVLPYLRGKKGVRRFTNIVLGEQAEFEDTCKVGWLPLYHKSLLWLVARGFERGKNDMEVPLLGMEYFLNQPAQTDATTWRKKIEAKSGQDGIVISGDQGAVDSLSQAVEHGDFDNDPATMKSILLRILDTKRSVPRHTYHPKGVALLETPPAISPVLTQTDTVTLPMAEVRTEEVPALAANLEDIMTPSMPPALPEVALAPRSGSSLEDVLDSLGWKSIP